MTARVAESERVLLTIARAMVGQVTPETVAPLLRRGVTLTELRPTAMRLLKETLARGVVIELARRGGWRSARHLRDGEPVSGRLWERHPAPAFRFSPASLDLCVWLATAPLGTARCPPLKTTPQTPADELLLLLAADLLMRAGFGAVVRQTPPLRDGLLVRLVLFAQIPEPISSASFAPLMTGQGALILEALQLDLSRRWIEADRARRKLGRPSDVQSCATMIDSILGPFLRDCEQSGRPDLAGFLIEACSQLLRSTRSAVEWLGATDSSASLRERSEARQASGILLRHLGTVHRWADAARHTAFFDDGYAAAQALAERWELVGDAGYTRAQEIIRDLDALDFEARQQSA